MEFQRSGVTTLIVLIFYDCQDAYEKYNAVFFCWLEGTIKPQELI